MEKLAFSFGVDFFDPRSSNNLDVLNTLEYESLSQREIRITEGRNRTSSRTVVLSEPGEQLEVFEIENEITTPLYRKICCFVCGPANL